MTATEKAKELNELLADLWNNAKPYFSGRRLEVQSKQMLRMRTILESLSALEAEKPEERAVSIALSIAYGCATGESTVEDDAQLIQKYAESYHAKNCAKCDNIRRCKTCDQKWPSRERS